MSTDSKKQPNLARRDFKIELEEQLKLNPLSNPEYAVLLATAKQLSFDSQQDALIFHAIKQDPDRLEGCKPKMLFKLHADRTE